MQVKMVNLPALVDNSINVKPADVTHVGAICSVFVLIDKSLDESLYLPKGLSSVLCEFNYLRDYQDYVYLSTRPIPDDNFPVLVFPRVTARAWENLFGISQSSNLHFEQIFAEPQ
jgi:hypothetical protein